MSLIAEVASMPDDGLRHEIDDGKLIAERPPDSRHGLIKTRVASLILDYVQQKRLGQTFSSTGFILGRNPEILRGPDVSFVRADRLHEVPDDGWPEMGPDLAIEIVSITDTARQMDRKVHQYLTAGTLAVWLLYPDTKSVHF
jgi:Uma2 family endonuclease